MAITTKATSNFSFRKLANAFDEVFDDFVENDFAEDAIKSAKEIIKGGQKAIDIVIDKITSKLTKRDRNLITSCDSMFCSKRTLVLENYI